MRERDLGREKAEEAEREPRAKVLLRFLESSGFSGHKFSEIFSNEEQKRNFIRGLNPESFLQMLNGINGILRNKPKAEWIMDGEQVEVRNLVGTSYTPPMHEDKPVLFKELLQFSQEMASKGRSLKDIALLAASSINAIHAYGDGNGRASRFIYSLLANDFSAETETKLKEVLSPEGRDVINVDPGLLKWEIYDVIRKEVGVNDHKKNPDRIKNFVQINEMAFQSDIPQPVRDLFTRVYHDDAQVFLWSILKHFQEQHITPSPSWLHEETKEDGDYEEGMEAGARLIVDKFLQDATRENLKPILLNYMGFKKRYVEILMDSIAHPEKPEYRIEVDSGKMSIKDYFESQIKK